MALRDTISASIPTIKKTSRTSEQKFFIHFQDLVVPEFVDIQDIRSQEFGRHAACEIFDALSANLSVGV